MNKYPVSHLKWTLNVPLNPQANASTSPPSNFLIEIKINPNKLDRPDLSIARTMVHELIHAEMWRKVLSILDNGGDLDGLTRQEWNQKLEEGDYPGMLDYYTRFGLNGFQHQQMAAHYRSTIADILAEFDNNQHSYQFYMDLAWEGLNHSNIVAWKDAITQSERDRIKQTIKDYINQHKNQGCE